MNTSFLGKSISLSIALSVCCGGCASWGKQGDANDRHADASLMQRLPFLGKKKTDDAPEPYPNPVKMAATWTPDTLVQTGRTPTRGFGGRIFFYNEKSQPVPVDGTLVIHGFDDQDASDQRKLKRFEFTPEQLTRHFGQSDLGASYSVWIPWDAVGGEQRKISLVPSFKTSDGNVVQGIPATVQLPGRKIAETPQDELAKFAPQYRRYREASQSGASHTGLATTTIRRRPHQDRQAVEPIQRDTDRIAAGPTQWMDLTPAIASPPADARPRRIGQLPIKVMPASSRLPRIQ